ncbi:hypothetical protein CIB48_g4167 [Xylaria polymorpha]|nr:hypothetical protein CIB48_g4167 [Xylaria polymorpha]
MTDEQDNILKNWKAKNSKDKDAVKPNYISLCRSLFGDIEVPANLTYTYWIPYYTTNHDYASLGERNETYVMERRAIAQPGSTAGFHQQQLAPDPQHPKTRYYLTKTLDLPNNGTYMDVTWDCNYGWSHSDGNMDFAMAGCYFDEAIQQVPVPPYQLEVEPDDGSDGPVG